jgi:hypothetical protein
MPVCPCPICPLIEMNTHVDRFSMAINDKNCEAVKGVPREANLNDQQIEELEKLFYLLRSRSPDLGIDKSKTFGDNKIYSMTLTRIRKVNMLNWKEYELSFHTLIPNSALLH